MRRHLRLVHKMVKVGEVLNNLHEVYMRPRALQAGKATKNSKRTVSKPSIITMKLPGLSNVVPGEPTPETNDEVLVSTLNTQKVSYQTNWEVAKKEKEPR